MGSVGLAAPRSGPLRSAPFPARPTRIGTDGPKLERIGPDLGTKDGGAGDDVMHGGIGNDTFSGGVGNDTLSGRDGSDTFVVGRGEGHDTVIGGADAGTIHVESHPIRDPSTSTRGTATRSADGFLELFADAGASSPSAMALWSASQGSSGSPGRPA
ncbi:MAG: hypothetical protein IT303_04080 [Dehalococcoidia bacterium]|nr:hypothetical protein [Dehalococcoidia bacterium]